MTTVRAALAAAALAIAHAAHAAPAGGMGRAPSPSGYWPSQTCAGCHSRTYEQHALSHHESSFRNPVFQAQYFEELLPRASRDPALVEEAKSCTACHAPVAWAFQRKFFTGAMPTDPSLSGVTCDLCHTITGFSGPEPRNGNFVTAPSDKKYGPFPTATNWHHVYSEVQTKSEFCATCHEAVNHRGLEVKATYSEWKKSGFAAQGVQCQDCHMTRDGFLVAGRPQFESGKASEDRLVNAPVRGRLYTHRFPGAHSTSQVEGAIGLAFQKTPAQARAGQTVAFSVSVDNHRSGHKMPTGSADLRLLWLEVTARIGDRTVQVPAKVKALGGYGVAGAGEVDDVLLGPDVPAGSRTYRAVFYDGDRKQTLASYDAVQIVWDNRLDSGEQRTEPYELTVPAGPSGTMQLRARLVYLPYPTSFAKRMEVAPAKPVDVAIATADVDVIPVPAKPKAAAP
jgi:nitrate/TMAO reductase-like tetraheme cytochrome c subunit